MIVPMKKYSILFYHKEYNKYLNDIQELGVIHIIEKESEMTDELREQYKIVDKFDQTLKSLEKREIDDDRKEFLSDSNGMQIFDDILVKEKRLDLLNQRLANEKKELIKAEPWGDFSKDMIETLKESNINIRFFTCSKKKYHSKEFSDFHTELISENKSHAYFVLIDTTDNLSQPDAEEVKIPERTYIEIKDNIKKTESEIEELNNSLDEYSISAVSTLKSTREELFENSEYNKAVFNTGIELDEKVMILNGWVPGSKEKKLNEFLEENNILYVSERPSKDDNVPILLKNNKFSRMFEPIGNLFSFPAYAELDLTAFFAPFFMMFFGFCLGDAGYGLLFIVLAGLYKLKAKQDLKPILSLVQLLGLATVIFGAISGTFFGINLIETKFDILASVQGLFLKPEMMFNLSLALGGVQIIFGIAVRFMNQIRQFGIMQSLGTLGWLITLLGGALSYILNLGEITLIIIVSIGAFLFLFMNDPKVNVFVRFGKGLWDVYSTITGIFGDLLSYIRLFALGLSSAILGFVINSIGLQILDSAPVIGHIFFVIFLLFGHTLNILISSLGSFVHPMRLTFVEFYKNAGFAGGGKEYKPLAKQK
jgi:V/A-type H+-transporting ATPase subunit I